MPLLKRNIQPRHLCRGALPESVSSELECVTNNTLSAIIRQLSSLSKHAEDIFIELFDEANTFYVRANSLQDRIERLAIKVTQLDSTVEEVSLQGINMRKAFKSTTIQDQQVVSKSSIPNPVVEIYNLSDKPPPLNILSPYRDDCKDGLKFYTDPSYFFDLWKEKMLQDTEDKKKEKRKQKEQKRGEDGTLQREVKKVRKARNRRQEWNMMALDKELRPDSRHTRTLHRGASSEGSLSPDKRSHDDIPDSSRSVTFPRSLASANHAQALSVAHPYLPEDRHVSSLEHEYQSIDMEYGGGAHPLATESVHGILPCPPTDHRMSAPQMVEYDNSSGLLLTPSAPLIPSALTAFASPPAGLPMATPPAGLPMATPTSVTGFRAAAAGYTPPSLPASEPLMAPAPPGPPPPPPGPPHSASTHEGKRQPIQPISTARSDLLSAIRMGIQLKKVQEQQELQAKREPDGNDVATILSRRIAVEYSDSDDDSDLEDNEWSD